MSENPATTLIISNITSALMRIRAIIFVNLGLCALIFSNAYLENFSLDARQLENSFVRRDAHQATLKEARADLKELSDRRDSQRYKAAALKESKYLAKIHFIDNSIKEHKLKSVIVPIIGVNIPSNDLNIICGIFLLFSSVWIIFSMNQINTSFKDDKTRQKIEEYFSAIKLSVVFFVFDDKKSLKTLGYSVIAAPAITVSVALFADIYSVLWEIQAIIQMNLWDLIILRLVFMSFIGACLWGIAIYTISVWKQLGQIMSSQNHAADS